MEAFANVHAGCPLQMLGAPYLVDAEHKGAVARFINHSCEPNLFAQPVCQVCPGLHT